MHRVRLSKFCIFAGVFSTDMKKFVFTAFFGVFMSIASVFTAEARNDVADNELSVILDGYGKESGVTAVRVQGTLLNIARTFASKDTKELMKCIDMMYMCYAGKATDDVKATVVSAVNGYFAEREGSYKKEEAEVEGAGVNVGTVTSWVRMGDGDTIVEIVVFSESMSTVMILTGSIPLSLIDESMAMFNEQNSQEQP